MLYETLALIGLYPQTGMSHESCHLVQFANKFATSRGCCMKHSNENSVLLLILYSNIQHVLSRKFGNIMQKRRVRS